jgi:hypothetical protein
MADDGPPSIHGKSSGTAQDEVVQRTTAEDEPPSIYGKSSDMAQSAAVQRAAAEDKPSSGTVQALQ